MSRNFVRLLVSLILVGSYFLLPRYGFTFHGDIAGHFLYPLSHANIWHLAGNILCLWVLRCPLHIFITYIIAVLCSFLPSFCLFDCIVNGSFAMADMPTYGFSGVLFAMVGISWGRIHRFKDMILRNKWILIIPAFLPHINFLIHLYCLLMGYAYGTIINPTHPFIPNSCAKKSATS